MTDSQCSRESILDNLKRRTTPTIPPLQNSSPNNTKPIRYGNVDFFAENILANQTRIERTKDIGSSVRLIAGYLKEKELPPEARVCADLKMLNWAENGITPAAGGSSEGSDLVCISQAYAGIADTGTLAVLSSAGNPTLLNFLPNHHILLLNEQRIVKEKDDLWSLLKQEELSLPRAVNFISGPSRTADIEQTIQLGAHGPRSLWLILYTTP